MLSDYSNAVTFSRGMMKHPIINNLFGDKLSFSNRAQGINPCFIGWGNKNNTKKVSSLAGKNNIPYLRFEDGFIRSVGLGVQGSPSFSVVADNLGIYYDATKPSRLEKLLSEHDFESDKDLLKNAEHAIDLIRKFKISKYNAAPDITNSGITDFEIKDNNRKKIVIIAQTAGDMSLEYGYGNNFSTGEIIETACRENPGADIYLKIHPDVIAGKKKSDLNLKDASSKCKVITRDVNPVSLLEKIDKVYTKSSQMGFEALLLGKECVCFGVPFYSGWGITDDRVKCDRRKRKLTVNQVFAAAYILYSHYYNPYIGKETDIIDTIYTIKKYRDIERSNGSTLLFYGFSLWKHFFHKHFFKSLKKTP